jgi:hypothetical protein
VCVCVFFIPFFFCLVFITVAYSTSSFSPFFSTFSFLITCLFHFPDPIYLLLLLLFLKDGWMLCDGVISH